MALITITEASTKYGVSDAHLRHLLLAGTIKGRKFGNSWAITEASLQRYLKTPRKPGPKPKRKAPRRA